MSVIVVDSSTIISCAVNCLIWIFDRLQQKGNRFVVPASVKREIVDQGLASQKYKYEAIRVMRYTLKGTFEVDKRDIKNEASRILNYANTSFTINGNPLKILQDADAEVVALAKKINADAIATDERTLRMLVENPEAMKPILEEKFHAKVGVNENSLRELSNIIKGVPVMRSVDIITTAFMAGIFEETEGYCKNVIPNCRKELIQGLLFALKFSGCAIAFEEVNEYVNLAIGGKL